MNKSEQADDILHGVVQMYQVVEESFIFLKYVSAML